MNLQQLNHNGKNLWVFIVTGVIALLITGVCWFCVEVITSYKGWPGEIGTENSRRSKSLAFRIALLVWLVKNGHTAWMWRSGAWLCILSNEKLGNFHAYAVVGPNEQRLHLIQLREKACDYVYRSIQSKEQWDNFHLSTVM